MSAIRAIAMLTAGGDAPGMNAAVRAVTRSALALGIRVVGVKRAYEGLARGLIKLLFRDLEDIGADEFAEFSERWQGGGGRQQGRHHQQRPRAVVPM